MSHHTSTTARGALVKACLAACAAGALFAAPAQAADITYDVSFDDPLGLGTAFYSDIQAHIGAALNQWTVHLAGSADYDVRVIIDHGVPRATGRSVTSGFFLHFAGYDIFEQGMAYELRTGIDNNGSLPDIEIALNPDYLVDELWFDPTPLDLHDDSVPADRLDATSLFVHEIGHALGFNGWGDGVTGALPAGYASTWDVWVRPDQEGHLHFHGPVAMSVYGGPVPVTNGANFHLGNASGPGADLMYDVMSGVTFVRGHRYAISGLELAMLKDMGVSVLPRAVVETLPLPIPAGSVPEPEAYALLLAGIVVVAGARIRRAPQRLVRTTRA